MNRRIVLIVGLISVVAVLGAGWFWVRSAAQGQLAALEDALRDNGISLSYTAHWNSFPLQPRLTLENVTAEGYGMRVTIPQLVLNSGWIPDGTVVFAAEQGLEYHINGKDVPLEDMDLSKFSQKERGKKFDSHLRKIMDGSYISGQNEGIRGVGKVDGVLLTSTYEVDDGKWQGTVGSIYGTRVNMKGVSTSYSGTTTWNAATGEFSAVDTPADATHTVDYGDTRTDGTYTGLESIISGRFSAEHGLETLKMISSAQRVRTENTDSSGTWSDELVPLKSTIALDLTPPQDPELPVGAITLGMTMEPATMTVRKDEAHMRGISEGFGFEFTGHMDFEAQTGTLEFTMLPTRSTLTVQAPESSETVIDLEVDSAGQRIEGAFNRKNESAHLHVAILPTDVRYAVDAPHTLDFLENLPLKSGKGQAKQWDFALHIRYPAAKAITTGDIGVGVQSSWQAMSNLPFSGPGNIDVAAQASIALIPLVSVGGFETLRNRPNVVTLKNLELNEGSDRLVLNIVAGVDSTLRPVLSGSLTTWGNIWRHLGTISPDIRQFTDEFQEHLSPLQIAAPAHNNIPGRQLNFETRDGTLYIQGIIPVALPVLTLP